MTGPGANSERFRIEWITRTGSTNADVLERARAGEPDGLVLVADHQRAGRGRLDRRWEAPEGANLLMSMLLRPNLEPSQWFRCTNAVAVALVEACAAHGVLARIKWPNDVVVAIPGGGNTAKLAGNTAKLAGILAEVADDAVVVGLGCNVGWPSAGEMPGATSLVARGASVTRATLLDDLLARFDEHAPDLHERYLARCASIGREVRLSLPDGREVTGTASTVDDEGRLVIETADGDRQAFTVGDVVHAPIS